MDNYSSDSLDKFFDESPLFEEYRLREKKELELFKKRKENKKAKEGLKGKLDDDFFKCRICHNKITNIRHVDIPVRNDLESVVVYYCANCRKTLPLY